MISVVILTMNEAGNMARCLDSIRWCDDILVLDSGSTDATTSIARDAGARVIVRDFDSFASQRNHAMDHGELRHGWVLHLDADEVVTAGLRDELMQLASAKEASFPVYRIPSKLIFMGRWLRYSGMYPAYQVRFGRRSSLRFVDHGHGQRESLPLEQVGTIAAPFEHFNFSKGINDWFSRHLRYAHAEAVQARSGTGQPLPWRDLFGGDPTARRRALKGLANRLPFRPTLRFLYAYVLRMGFLDGRPGFHYASMLATYQRFIDLNIIELEARGERAAGSAAS